MAEKNEGNFLIKISKVNPGSHAASNFLKPDDIIIALDNQLYTFGEKQLNQDLKELKKNQQKTIITILREETFFDLKIGNSLGCKFVTTTKEETSKIINALKDLKDKLEKKKKFFFTYRYKRQFISYI